MTKCIKMPSLPISSIYAYTSPSTQRLKSMAVGRSAATPGSDSRLATSRSNTASCKGFQKRDDPYPVVLRNSQMLQNQQQRVPSCNLSFGRLDVSFLGVSARPHNRTFAGLHNANSARWDRSWYPQTSAADCFWHVQLPKRPETKKITSFPSIYRISCQAHVKSTIFFVFLCSSKVLDVQTLMKVMVHPFQ